MGNHQNTSEVFLLWPNLIGYIRIILASASLYYMPIHPRSCSFLYSVSCLLDALDGYVARRFNQGTTFGAVLDMVTDRCTTACLLIFLASAFPRWAIVFQGLISLDLASHYVHMYATLSTGGSSHKSVDPKRSRLLHLYYTNRTVLFSVCLLNETFFIALYLLSFSSPFLSPALLRDQSTAAAIFQNPYSAGALELARANKIDSTVPWIVAAISFPGMALKQFLNVVQLKKASVLLAEGDANIREEKGLSRRKKTAQRIQHEKLG